MLVLALLALACGRGAPRLRPGDHSFRLEHDGRERSYIVHMPPSARAGDALPVVFNLHGGGGNARQHKQDNALDAAAEAHGYIALYPNGSGAAENILLTWNAGGCCGYAAENDIDDVGFLLAALDDLAARTPVDEARIYVTGFSNGAMMAYRLAVEASDRVAAVAAVAGAMQADSFAPSRSLPVLHIHSRDDPRALYAGGLGPPFPLTDNRVHHNSVEEELARWAAFNQCAVEPTVVDTRADGGHTATRFSYAPCATGAEVVLWQLTGAGHVWPGAPPTNREAVSGPATSVIDASEEIWAFFNQYELEQ